MRSGSNTVPSARKADRKCNKTFCKLSLNLPAANVIGIECQGFFFFRF